MGSTQYDDVTGTMVFDYGPIPDEVFAMEVPEGYQELPRKQPGTVSGKVVDENGQPAAYAQIYIADKMGMFAEGAQTGADGSFMFKMPPVAPKSTLSLPIILRAFFETDPDRVAWTIIAEPGSEDDGTMPVPGEIGQVVNQDSRLKEASGIILKMEPAAKIHGRVTDVEGNPVGGAWVSVRGYPADKWGNEDHSMYVFTFAGPGERGTVQTQTDEHGRYEVHNLPRLWKESSYHFRAGADGFVNSESKFRTKGKRNISGVDLQLYRAGITVRGVLVDNYGELLAERYIYPVVAEEVFRSCQTVTDERGRFQVDGCPVSKDLKIKAMLQHRVASPYSQEKKSEYVYYPDAFVGIDFEPDKTRYEIKLVAARPELVLNVEVKNTAGQILKYYPVEIRGDAGTISRAWKVENKLERRTDVNGRCRFTEVPNVNGLKIVLYAGNKIPNEQLSGEAKRIAEQHEKEYFWG
ncbi:MAG: carboxypeptidase regulatory-like domain-containing protein, partial [Planctomycetes bacterium]|nr:carboxypeptidase regulatory-like domain-containing protein [Planctomycetota bacterium]